jgi:hypothetical protein
METLIEVTTYIFYTIAASIVFIGLADLYKKRKK